MASIHDIKLVKTLVNQYLNARILANSEYISQAFQVNLKRKDIWL